MHLALARWVLGTEAAFTGAWAVFTWLRQAKTVWGWSDGVTLVLAALALGATNLAALGGWTGSPLSLGLAIEAWAASAALAALGLQAARRPQGRGQVFRYGGVALAWLGSDGALALGGRLGLGRAALCVCLLLALVVATGRVRRRAARIGSSTNTAAIWAAGGLGLRLALGPALPTGELAGWWSAWGWVAFALVLGLTLTAGRANLGLVAQLARAEAEAWHQGEERFRQLMDNAADLFMVLDPSGNIRYASDSARLWLGWPKEALVGRSFLELFAPGRQPGWEQIARAASLEPMTRLKFALRHQDGSVKTFEGTARRLDASPSNPWHGLILNLRDVTEAEVEHARLVQSQARSLTAQRMAKIGYWDYDYVTRTLSWPAETFRLFGLDPDHPPKDLLRWFLQAVPEEDRPRLRQALERTARQGAPYFVEHRLRLPDGRLRVLESRAEPVRDPQGHLQGLIGVFHDVTERQEREAILARARSAEALERLAAGIAHDFNNQLAAILGNLSLAQAYLSRDVGRVEAFLQAADAAGQKARELANRLMSFARGKPLSPERLDLPRLLSQLAAETSPDAPARVVYTPQGALWPVALDAEECQHLFRELIKNALDASKPGDTIRLVSQSVRDPDPAHPGPWVVVTVEDQGPGIAPEHLPRIFDPYFSTKPRHGGMGLATAEAIARRHGGYIRVASSPGRGTRVSVYFPSQEQEAAAEPQVRLGSLPPLKVLVMDDEPGVREVVSSMLTLLGAQVVAAADGQEAVSSYQRALREGARFDLAILDWTVPTGMGGAETLAALKAIDPAVKAVLSTGYAEGAGTDRYRELGFAGLITKPYRLEDLERLLRKLFPQSPAVGTTAARADELSSPR